MTVLFLSPFTVLQNAFLEIAGAAMDQFIDNEHMTDAVPVASVLIHAQKHASGGSYYVEYISNLLNS